MSIGKGNNNKIIYIKFKFHIYRNNLQTIQEICCTNKEKVIQQAREQDLITFFPYFKNLIRIILEYIDSFESKIMYVVKNFNSRNIPVRNKGKMLSFYLMKKTVFYCLSKLSNCYLA